ncbi:putative glycolipid-binding domain-containing protein [Nocardiopsis sp. RSe5-2]|uniref:Glycolipid-binding domain-containing protein n=1 Tax=Nocardiopsis endophytica TaxID=3018445 RepID=A0ABT4U8S1_9ACTN|nr:putative glycolipid-binding domain-containing protein [Nocardiopsis endophytica]MDA2813346.1 putative glycolipid-binding domain-containing protein [Nocardiopsis endophytica]
MCELPAAWRRLGGEGTGVGTVIAERDGFRLEAAEAAAGERPYGGRLTVRTDLAWEVVRARVETVTDQGMRALDLSREGALWSVDGTRRPDLDGCVDVWAPCTPLTVTLPVRRLGLRRGEARDVAMAWVEVPGLTVRKVLRRCTRLEPSGGRECYEISDEALGTVTVTVDREGVPVDIEGLYARAA